MIRPRCNVVCEQFPVESADGEDHAGLAELPEPYKFAGVFVNYLVRDPLVALVLEVPLNGFGEGLAGIRGALGRRRPA